MASKITRLQLTNFRNYSTLDLETDAQFIALTGENGAGKTNLLEAVSYLCAGRGLRRADSSEVTFKGTSSGWAVSARLAGSSGNVQLGTGIETAEQARKCRIDRVTVSSASAFAEHIRLVWLTPSQDGLFAGSAGERRRFLDRLVLAVDVSHGARVNSLERALRSRNKLLEDTCFDPVWANSIEREIAEIGVSVAAARSETVERLKALISRQREENSPFPYAQIALTGQLEIKLLYEPAIDVEEWFKEELRTTRARDRAAGRTLTGPQMCDLTVIHGPKQTVASQSSTGEQKALLIGLILAHSQLVSEMTAMTPVLLLDEIAAHLDPRRRAALYELLHYLGGQVFMSGTDASLFEGLQTDSMKLTVSGGTIIT